MEPCILQMGDKVIMHPILYEEFKRRVKANDQGNFSLMG
jgi:hypothetical protein